MVSTFIFKNDVLLSPLSFINAINTDYFLSSTGEKGGKCLYLLHIGFQLVLTGILIVYHHAPGVAYRARRQGGR